jgi:cell division septation protein DedD
MAKKTRKSKKVARKTYRIEMTSLSIGFWALCLFFLLSWIFVLGIFLGRGFLPSGVNLLSELKDRITGMQTRAIPNKASNSRSEKKEEEDPKLAFYERLSSKKNEVRLRVQPKANGTGSSDELQVKGSAAGALKSDPNEKQQTLNKQVTSAEDKPRYTVQLASLGEKGRAEAMIKGLIGRGYDAFFYEAVVGGKTYYRVRCGKFMTREQAGEHARKLAKEAGLKGFVTRVE